jgi:para-aminobenzoate synthetase / 4-amino-4-deoxychorismate lyase
LRTVDDLFAATLQVGPQAWLAFRDPVLVLQADSPGAVRRTLVDVEQLTRDRGLHAVGFLTYEAAEAFGLPVHDAPADLPLAWFALYEPKTVTGAGRPQRSGDYTLGPFAPSVARGQFDRAFSQIKEHLAAGDSYQVNYTFRMTGAFEGDASSLFADLCTAQQGEYSAMIDLGDHVICSASPELFFELRGADILARPMKGTARRGRTLAEDRARGAALAASEKERAENVMVVDMVRNDVGRIADVGTVEAPELFTVERYPNVWQMTSLVKGRTLAPLDEVFAALHPSASVTGAPKARTMELLRELESGPRGVYTGAIGHVPPDGLARFSVAIRTAVIDRKSARLSFGVGSGIVWDSDASAEYAECMLKGSVLGRQPVEFDLLETLRWTPHEGYYLLDRHLQRLRDSGEYFGVPVVLSDVHDVLSSAVAGAEAPLRVRLLVDREGGARAEHGAHVPTSGTLRVVLAAEPVDPSDVFLFHKTTNRAVYDRARGSGAGADDVVLWNGAGEVTETTTANVVAEIDGVRVTPPVTCGLLAGTCRAAMLDEGEIREAVVTLADLRRATSLWLINSVHGMRPAVLANDRP